MIVPWHPDLRAPGEANQGLPAGNPGRPFVLPLSPPVKGLSVMGFKGSHTGSLR